MLYRIRNFFIIALMILAAFTLQYTIFAKLPFLNCGPNFLLILTCYFGYSRGKNAGMLVGICAGLLIDIFFAEILGVNALVFVVIGFVTGIWNKYFYSNNIALPMIILVGSDIAYLIAYFFARFVFNSNFPIGYSILHVALPELALTFVAGIIIFLPLRHLIKKMYKYYEEDAKEQ